MSVDLKTEWLEDFTLRLCDLKIACKRIPLAVLQAVFAEVFTHRPGISQRRDWQLEAFRYAEQKGVITFPKTSWDRTSKTALPKYVVRIVEIPEKNPWWKTHYWYPQLEWVADLPSLSEEYGNFLLKVQLGLKEGWFKESAPLNRRSVELTGKEKRLKKLLQSSLFAENRLKRELLNITSDVMPLAHEFVGNKPIALIFENREPFNVALSVLEKLPNSPYGILAYGGGNSFVDSIGDFLRIQKSMRYQTHFKVTLEQIHYVGDLDWAGLIIARRIGLAAQKYGLPFPIPAIGIHQAMLNSLLDSRINHPDGFPDDEIKKARIADPSLIKWLPSGIQEEILRILNLNNRIPEEMLTAEIFLSLWN
jgi:hypothetical protein